MTREVRSISANERFKASYDGILAASLGRAVLLHLMALAVWPPLGTVHDTGPIRITRAIWWSSDVIHCGVGSGFTLPDSVDERRVRSPARTTDRTRDREAPA